MKNTFIILLSLVLVSCGSSPKTVSNNSVAGTYTFDGSDDELKEVGSKAQSNCEQSGRLASLKNIDKTDDGKVATFECVPRP